MPIADEHAGKTTLRLAKGKARPLTAASPAALIIGTDQTAWCERRQLGKPMNVANAQQVLANLSGERVELYGAIVLLNTATDKVQHHADHTAVTICRLSREQISRYLEREPGAAYRVGATKGEGPGAVLSEHIESTDPNASIGLPIFRLTDFLKNEGVEILQFEAIWAYSDGLRLFGAAGMKSILYLTPTPLGAPDTPSLLPYEQQAIVGLTGLVVEAKKTARAHLKYLGVTTPIHELNLQTLNEHTDLKVLPELLEPLQEGCSMGTVNEAGYPAIADPDANLVALAHKYGSEVRLLVGPFSLLLALMTSGANGQNFASKSYLSSEKNERIRRLKALEQRSHQQNGTQLLIEAPYRNDALLADAVENLHPETRLCVVADLTLPTQGVVSQTIAQWREREETPNLKKRPTIFVLHAA